MTEALFTLDDLRRILIEGAGADEGVDLDGDILDVWFAELGYDSLAILETSSRVSRQYRVELDDAAVMAAVTPRAFIELVNASRALEASA
jgi:act minimal PKS acyl carrier protein